VPHYWAKFKTVDSAVFRFDTRIYLHSIDKPADNDATVGCVIGKNPGSALGEIGRRRLAPIALSGDKFLPTVRAIVSKAYLAAELPLPERGYIQVLNLFYLCNRHLVEAKRSYAAVQRPPRCPAEKLSFPWAWYVWGGTDRTLDPLKKRFRRRKDGSAFFMTTAYPA